MRPFVSIAPGDALDAGRQYPDESAEVAERVARVKLSAADLRALATDLDAMDATGAALARALADRIEARS